MGNVANKTHHSNERTRALPWITPILLFSPAIIFAVLMNSVVQAQFTVRAERYNPEVQVPIKMVNLAIGLLVIGIALARGRRMNDRFFWRRMSPFVVLGLFGAIVGAAMNNPSWRYWSHAYNVLLLVVMALGAFLVTRDLYHQPLDRKLGYLALILLVYTSYKLVVLYESAVGWKLSLNLMTLAIPAVYFVIKRRVIGVVTVMGIALASGRRGLMLNVAALLIMNMTRVGGEKKTRRLIAAAIGVCLVSVALLGDFQASVAGGASRMFGRVTENLGERLAFVRVGEWESLDEWITEATSHRNWDIGQVYEKLSREGAYLTGMGFGGGFRARMAQGYFSDTFVSDVELFYYWLLYGYVFGTALYVYILYLLAKNILFSRRQGSTEWYRFCVALFMFMVVNDISGLQSADPLIGISLGMALGAEWSFMRAVGNGQERASRQPARQGGPSDDRSNHV
jgi:hypothetical protein